MWKTVFRYSRVPNIEVLVELSRLGRRLGLRYLTESLVGLNWSWHNVVRSRWSEEVNSY